MSFGKKDLFLFLFLLFLSFFIFFLDKKYPLNQVKNFFEKPFIFLEKQTRFLVDSFSFSLKNFFGREDKIAINNLEKEVQRLAVEHNKLSFCLEENEKMKRMLGAPFSPKRKFLPALVVGIGERLKIDRGEKDGIRKGMIVVSENILVGRVVMVNEQTSLIELPTSYKVVIPVVIKRVGGQGIQARGIIQSLGGDLLLTEVLQKEDIQKGDLVVTAGDENWPAELVVGQISDVLPKSAEVYQKARVKPLLEYDKLRIVFIIISN